MISIFLGEGYQRQLESEKIEPTSCGTVNWRDTASCVDCSFGVVKDLKCRSGVLASDSVALLKQFYQGENPHAPNPKDKSKRRK